MWKVNWYRDDENSPGSFNLSWFSRLVAIIQPPTNIGRPIYPNMGIPGRNYEKAVLGRDGLYKSKRKRKRKYDYYEQGF